MSRKFLDGRDPLSQIAIAVLLAVCILAAAVLIFRAMALRSFNHKNKNICSEVSLYDRSNF